MMRFEISPDCPQRMPHFMCTCAECGQQFEFCGLPCFVFCPGCKLMLVLTFKQG